MTLAAVIAALEDAIERRPPIKGKTVAAQQAASATLASKGSPVDVPVLLAPRLEKLEAKLIGSTQARKWLIKHLPKGIRRRLGCRAVEAADPEADRPQSRRP